MAAMYSLPIVMAGGALGAGARHLAGRLALALAGPGFPWGTLAVNLSGGLLMGLLAGVLARGGATEGVRLFLAVGVLGGFTTFSAFGLDTVALIQRGAGAAALAYVLASVIGSLVLVYAGLLLMRAPA